MNLGGHFVRLLKDYNDSTPVVATGWLKEQLEEIRSAISLKGSGAISSSPTWSNWRMIAGMSRASKSGAISTKERYCTQRQAARIILLALWKPEGQHCIQDAIGEESLLDKFGQKLKAKDITALNIDILFNMWMRATGGVEAQALLDKIHELPDRMTGQQLSDISAILDPKKRIPPQNFNHVIRGLGEKISREKQCSKGATRKILRWLFTRQQDWQPSSQESNQHLLPS